MKYTGERFIPTECTDEMAIEHYQRYQFARNITAGKIILDAACGEGYGTCLLSQDALRVVGIDIDPDTISSAKERYKRENTEFVTGSIDSLPFDDNTFDMVVSFETLEHVEPKSQNAFLKEIIRVLKKDGLLMISTPNKAVYTDLVHGENIHHLKEFYADEYQAFLAQYFRYTTFYHQSPLVQYLITSENAEVSVPAGKTTAEESRYIIAVCSNTVKDIIIPTQDTARANNSMYYFLYCRLHDLEKELSKTKQEADIFAASLEESIAQQKEYIGHLLHDIECLKGEITDIQNTSGKYAAHLENDIEVLKKKDTDQQNTITEQEKYILQLQQNIECLENELTESRAASNEYITHLEHDIEQQKKDQLTSKAASDEYIAHLEHDLERLKNEHLISKAASDEYIAHLEHDLARLKNDYLISKAASDEYIAHLEHDIAVIKGEQI